MKRIVLTAIFLVFITALRSSAQSCFNVAAGNDTTIACSQACLDLKAKIPDVRTTDDYQVVSIPYTPYPYTNPGGVVFNPTYIDDDYSSEITLPFTFCFYGVNYTKCVVGTNGILTFELTNANTFNAWLLNLGTTSAPGAIQPIPYPAGGTPNDPDRAYYPRASIMGPYHDIDPQTTVIPPPAGMKMEYIIVGTAPCRKFILNYNNIPYFACPNVIVTQQMVLYEGTGIIDIFLKNKPITCLPTTNEGRAILGLQNWDRDKAVVVPGRNNTIWSATNEGWRFIPSGGTSLFKRVELYRNGTLLSTGTTVPLGNGELEATFPNICQPEDSMSYQVRAFYQKCDDPTIETEGSDTVIVYRNAASAITANVSNIQCNGGGTGSITITSPVGPTFEYSVDGVTWQSSPTFTLPAGTYNVRSRQIGSSCASSQSFTITEPTLLTATVVTGIATCASNTGSITINANGGAPAYEYSIDNGVTYQPSNQFLNLPQGNYPNIRIRDANGCVQNRSTVINFVDTMYLELGGDTTVCSGSSIVLVPFTNLQTDTFKWTPATGLHSDTARNPIATPTVTTTYFLNAKWGICERTDAITVHVLNKPIVYAGIDTAICYMGTAYLHGNVYNTSGNVSCSWTPSATLLTPTRINTFAKPGQTQQFVFRVRDEYGCNFSVYDTMEVIMMPLVKAFAGNDTNALVGQPHQLLGSGGRYYNWTPSQPLNNHNLAAPLATLYNDTYFTLEVADSIGCSNIDYVFIKVYQGPTYYLPNSFTPNGDGLNDIFRPVPVGIVQTEFFQVYNRYGEKLFETTEWKKGWNGMYKGNKASADTYVWVIKGTDKFGKTVLKKGSVILIR